MEFDVAANDSNEGASARKMVKSLQLFEEAGCRAALRQTFKGIFVGQSGSPTLKIMSVKNDVFISTLYIFTTDPNSGTALKSPQVSATLKDYVEIEVDSGVPSDTDLVGMKKSATADSIARTNPIAQKQLQTTGFKVSLIANDIVRGFPHNFNSFCAESRKRSSNFYINDMIDFELEAGNILTQAGYFKGMEDGLKKQIVRALDTTL